MFFKKKKEKKIEPVEISKIFEYIVVIICIPTLIILFFDMNNISPINLTKNYDWLSYLGSMIAALATTFLGIVSYRQNKTLEAINKEMIQENTKSSCFSDIYFVETGRVQDKYLKTDGIEYPVFTEKDNTAAFPIIFCVRIKDKKNLPLKSFNLDNVNLFFPNTDEFFAAFSISLIDVINNKNYSLSKFVALDDDEKSDEGCYQVSFIALLDNEHKEQILKTYFVEISFDLEVENVFNVTSVYNARVTLNRNEDKPNIVILNVGSFSLECKNIFLESK